MRYILLFLLLLLSGFTYAASGKTSAGFKIGIAFPEDVGPAFCLGGHLTFLGIAKTIPTLGFEPRFDFWWASEDQYYYPVGNLDNDYTTFRFLGNMKYILPVEAEVKPYFGIGLGFFIISRSIETVHWNGHTYVIYRDTDTDVDLGMLMFGGIEIPVAKKSNLLFEFGFSVDGFETAHLLGGMSFGLQN